MLTSSPLESFVTPWPAMHAAFRSTGGPARRVANVETLRRTSQLRLRLLRTMIAFVDLGRKPRCSDRLNRVPTGLGKTEGVLAAWAWNRQAFGTRRSPEWRSMRIQVQVAAIRANETRSRDTVTPSNDVGVRTQVAKQGF